MTKDDLLFLVLNWFAGKTWWVEGLHFSAMCKTEEGQVTRGTQENSRNSLPVPSSLPGHSIWSWVACTALNTSLLIHLWPHFPDLSKRWSSVSKGWKKKHFTRNLCSQFHLLSVLHASLSPLPALPHHKTDSSICSSAYLVLFTRMSKSTTEFIHLME